MTSWPGTLPSAPLLDGFNETGVDLTVRSKMDIGPDKSRRRFTGEMFDIQMQFIMTKTQVNALRTFFYTTLDGGVDEFDFTHPITDATVSMRFKKPYAVVTEGSLFRVSCDVEVMP